MLVPRCKIFLAFCNLEVLMSGFLVPCPTCCPPVNSFCMPPPIRDNSLKPVLDPKLEPAIIPPPMFPPPAYICLLELNCPIPVDPPLLNDGLLRYINFCLRRCSLNHKHLIQQITLVIKVQRFLLHLT